MPPNSKNRGLRSLPPCGGVRRAEPPVARIKSFSSLASSLLCPQRRKEETEIEKLEEMKTLIENLKIDARFVTDGASNLIQVRGNLKTDKQKMIAFLKKTRFGRATSLPLTSITKPQEFKMPDVLKEKGVIGLADSIVKVDKKYQNVAKTMLGRIVVIDHIDNAVKIAKKYNQNPTKILILNSLTPNMIKKGQILIIDN